MLEIRQIIVRPRVYLPGSSDALPLEDEIRERIERQQPGLVELCGPPGSGKSSSLEYLSRAFAGEAFLVLADRADGPQSQALWTLSGSRLVVCASAACTFPADIRVAWRLAPWSQDEWLEYLLAAHHERCASAMQRILAARDRAWLGGLPELWKPVLDQMAADESLPSVRSALRNVLHSLLPKGVDRTFIAGICFENRSDKYEIAAALGDLELEETAAARVRLLVRHEQVQHVLAVDWVLARLHADASGEVLETILSPGFIREIGALLRGDDSLIGRLKRITTRGPYTRNAMAASILHAAGVTWRPRSRRVPHLSGAVLPGLSWPEIRLRDLRVNHADLSDADLHESRLHKLSAVHAQMSGVNLHGARIKELVATRADLSGADLSFVRARGAIFARANLGNANLEGALLRNCAFSGANLQGARFCRAELSASDFRDSKLAGADFSGANLAGANLSDLVLRQAEFAGATLPQASLFECDLEQMRLPGANFEEAHLDGSYLSASHMPRANFRGAGLRSTGLADIHWEGADLRDADLRGASFHLGSSRSGLVGSPIACEGSRTGFYSDEYYDQDFRPPEEIRKANLCGADLRGAHIDEVDFYLVDLRGAHYTTDQEEYFRKCKAILQLRV